MVPTEPPDKQAIRSMLKSLGFLVRDERQQPHFDWVMFVRATPEVDVALAQPTGKPFLQVQMTLNLTDEDLDHFQRRWGPEGVAEVASKLKLTFLADHLDYQFDGGLKSITVKDFLGHDALSLDRLHQSLRRAKDSYYKVVVILQMMEVLSPESRKEPRHMDELKRRTSTSSLTVSSLPLEGETVDRMQKELPPGQSFDEFIMRLLDEHEKNK